MPLESSDSGTAQNAEQITDQTHAAVEGSPAGGSAVEQSGGSRDAVDNSGIDPQLAELAQFHELDPADFPNQEQLARAVARLDRVYAHRVKQGWETRREPEPRTQTTTDRSTEKPSIKPFEHGLKPLVGADYDPEIVKFSEGVLKTIEAMNAHYQQQLQAYEQKFGELEPYGQKISQFEQYLQEQSVQQYTSQMDSAFSKLGKEWEEVFGKGDITSLPAHSLARQKRDELSMELAAIQQGDAQMGRRQTFEQQFQRALRSAFGDYLPTIERRRLALAAHQRGKGGALAPTTSKKQPPPTDESEVLSRLAEWRERVEARA